MIDSNSTAVLSWDSGVPLRPPQQSHNDGALLQVEDGVLGNQDKVASDECVGVGQLSIVKLLLSSPQPIYINSIVSVPLDFRLFLDNKKVYDISKIETVRLSRLAYDACANVIVDNLAHAKLKIVSEEDVFDNLNESTVGVANVYNATRDLSMSASNLTQQDLVVKYCTISNQSKFDRLANKVWLATKMRDLSVDIMSILSLLTLSNTKLISINTVDQYILVEIEGNIKDKKIGQLLTSLRELTKDLRVLANI
jgi:prephenate dehydratase